MKRVREEIGRVADERDDDGRRSKRPRSISPTMEGSDRGGGGTRSSSTETSAVGSSTAGGNHDVASAGGRRADDARSSSSARGAADHAMCSGGHREQVMNLIPEIRPDRVGVGGRGSGSPASISSHSSIEGAGTRRDRGGGDERNGASDSFPCGENARQVSVLDVAGPSSGRVGGGGIVDTDARDKYNDRKMSAFQQHGVNPGISLQVQSQVSSTTSGKLCSGAFARVSRCTADDGEKHSNPHARTLDIRRMSTGGDSNICNKNGPSSSAAVASAKSQSYDATKCSHRRLPSVLSCMVQPSQGVEDLRSFAASPPSSSSPTRTTATRGEVRDTSTTSDPDCDQSSWEICDGGIAGLGMGPTGGGRGGGASLGGGGSDRNVAVMDRAFELLALSGVAAWLFLLCVMHHVTPAEHYQRLDHVERYAATVASALHLISLLTKCIRLTLKRGGRALGSGVMKCAIIVQLIATVTNAAMATMEVPVLTDPVTGACVYPIRYCEWAALAFVMTFLTEGANVPEDDEYDVDDIHNAAENNFRGGNDHRHHRRFERPQSLSLLKDERACRILCRPLLLGLSQGISTLAGLIFPYLPNRASWICTMIISCSLYSVLFPRLYLKRRALGRLDRGKSVVEVERFERANLSYRLLFSCVTVWSLLVFFFFFASFAPMIFPSSEDSFVHHPSLPFLSDTLFDVISKAFYMDIIVEVHDAIFDDGARAARRLEELRRMMSVVWECSSDVISISVRGYNGRVTTMLSPTYLKILGFNNIGGGGGGGGLSLSGQGLGHDLGRDQGQQMAVLFEQDPSEFICSNDSTRARTHSTTSAHPPTPDGEFHCIDIADGRKIYIHDPAFHAATRGGLESMRRLMVKAWTAGDSSVDNDGGKNGTATSDRDDRQPGDRDVLLMHDLHVRDSSSIHCEGKVTRLEANSLVVVIRDISERCRRFEAEKKAISETTARTKDAEANRFTRHEVKNGLLAALALCDSLKDSLSVELSNSSSAPSSSSAFRRQSNPVYTPTVSSSVTISELDSTLREILDTILAEAMARDVIHEVYEPKMERVNLQNVLCCSRGYGQGTRSRFPLVTYPAPLPIFFFDPQLLRYIHRNAISNACKYGKRGGVVLTEVRFYPDRSELELNVINLPGENHANLVQLGDKAQRAVFEPGKRLHSNANAVNDGHTSHSSGDGAWISSKCAKTFGGQCDIRFEENRTVFTLRCPATTFDVAMQNTNFKLPEDTWGIAIDDSKIQRKLMHRFFSLVGIPDRKQVVLGKDADEIRGFNDVVTDIVREHPESYFLLIADENLDIMEDDTHHQTVSGSMCIKKLRQQLGSDDETRILALVRSANDSGSDIALYKSRAHGFFPKAPIKRDKVIEVLAPLWAQRFPDSLFGEARGNHQQARVQQRADVDVFVSSAADLMQTLDVIEALCFQNEAILPARWSVLWEKFHALKGDLKTLQQSERVIDALNLIDGLQGPTIPNDFISKWRMIRSLIIEVIA